MTVVSTKGRIFCTWIALTSATILNSSCDGGTASCNEACDKSKDCQDGLACYMVSDGAKRCIPDGCDACFDQGKSCYWDENTDEQSQGENLECSFRECG